ncbi:MAG: FKBP-type peptidyl-prolyl cis-trans isomerase [Acidobacteriota bacterium]
MKLKWLLFAVAAVGLIALAACKKQEAPAKEAQANTPETQAPAQQAAPEAPANQPAAEAPKAETSKPAPEASKPAEPSKPAAKKELKYVTLPDGLKYADMKVGTGEAAKAGDEVVVNYTGRLKDGTVFDSSYSRHQPFTFTLGAGRVIKGWDVGVAGMKVGGKRRLIIPPDLAYGARGAGGVIPPNATLTFDVQLLEIH